MRYIIFSCSKEEEETLNKSPYPPNEVIEANSLSENCLGFVYESYHAFDEALKLIGRGIKDNENNLVK